MVFTVNLKFPDKKYPQKFFEKSIWIQKGVDFWKNRTPRNFFKKRFIRMFDPPFGGAIRGTREGDTGRGDHHGGYLLTSYQQTKKVTHIVSVDNFL
jgi:hypothetical protein